VGYPHSLHMIHAPGRPGSWQPWFVADPSKVAWADPSKVAHVYPWQIRVRLLGPAPPA
jgi:hypothetical protein